MNNLDGCLDRLERNRPEGCATCAGWGWIVRYPDDPRPAGPPQYRQRRQPLDACPDCGRATPTVEIRYVDHIEIHDVRGRGWHRVYEYEDDEQ